MTSETSDEWDWEFSDRAQNQFNRLDPPLQEEIASKLDEIGTHYTAGLIDISLQLISITMSWSTNPDVFLFGPAGVLNRVKMFGGGLYLALIGWYSVLVLYDSIRNGELVLLQSSNAWYLSLVVGTVLVALWLGYSDGGLLVAGAVGLAPGIAFATIGLIVGVLGLSSPDAPMWFFVLALFVFGVILASCGFVIGKGMQFALGA